MKIKSAPFLYITLFVSLYLLLFSCKKDPNSIIGGSIQPGDEFITAKFNDTSACLDLIAFTSFSDSIVTSNRSVQNLGSYYHPVFGVMTSNIITQVLQEDLMDTANNSCYAIDSAFINLIYSSAYPTDDVYDHTTMTIRVGELVNATVIDTISLSKNYYNTTNEDFIPGNVLSDFTFTPNLHDSVYSSDGDSSSSKIANLILKLPMEQAYAEKLMVASQNYQSINQFLTDIKGLYFEAIPETRPGSGQIVNFDFGSTSSHIVIYYRKTAEDTVSTVKYYQLNFTGSKTYSHIYVDRSMAAPNYLAQLNGDTSKGQEKLYMQACGSSSIHFKIPNIREFKNVEDNTIVINQASIVMEVDMEYDRFEPPSTLLLVVKKDSTLTTIRDYSTQSEVSYNSGKKEYRFYITNHMQNLLLNESAENYTLSIYDYNELGIPACFSAFGPSRAINDGKRMRLEVLYTIIP